MSKSSSKPTLGYWKIRGIAQPIRLLLKYLGEDFEDLKYEIGDAPEFSRDAWLSVKYTIGLDFPNLPYYIDGEVKLTQSNAILRYFGRKYDLVGKTEEEIMKVDMMLYTAFDFRNGMVRMAYSPDYETLLEEYKPKKMKDYLESFEKWLSKNKWFAGDNITVVDFYMYELLAQHKLMIRGVLDDYPRLTAYQARFEALPNIKAYMASPDFMERPVNNKRASFK